MGNYLRIYKDLDEFKSNAFNLPYPCVSVVDDDTIETDEEIVEFEQLDKLSFKVEVPLENASTECVNVASFSNPISVEGYSINGGDAVFIDLPQLIDTTQEIVWVYQNIEGVDMYAPSYDNHMLISDLNSDLKIKTNRPINEDDFIFMSLGLGGQVAMAQPIPMTELNGALIMEEPTVYKFHSDFLAELKNGFASLPEGVVICFAFVDNGYVIGSGQTKPSITTSVGALKYETELKETKVEFVLTEVNGKSGYLPSDNYLFYVFSINNDTRIKISRALVETDYVMMISALDGQILGLDLAPLSEAPIDMLLVPYSETEFGFSQEFIDSITSSGDVPSGYKIGLYFVDNAYAESGLQTIPTIDNYVMAEVTIGGLANLCVPSEEIPSDGVVEVRMKATNDLKNISFVNKQNLKSFDGSRYGLNNIKEISSKQFESSDKLEEFIIPNGVETVGDFAFNNCFSLSSVTIPESVTEIGAKAFRKCMFLSENFINQSSLDAEANNYWKANVYDVIQEDGLCIRGTSVWGCKPNSSGVTIPDYITRIEENAFIGCTNLKRVDMPNSIKYIGKNAFRYCINVEKVVIPESVEEIASDAFTYCFFDLDIFENKSNINAKENNYWQAVICKDNCVSSCDVLLYVSGENIVIHDGVKEINADAVRNRESIKSIIIPNSVTSIGSSAFTNCISLSSIEIPSSVTSIGDYAFSGCTSLTSVTIPSSVIRIGTSAFDCCYFQRDNFIYNGLCDAEFNNWWGATLYDIVQDDGLCISGTTAVGCRPNATNVTIPSSVTNIGDYAFYNCSGLTSIVILDNVTTIGDYAFRYCTSLTSVTIPDSVTEIGYAAFRDCISLTAVTIPSSVTNINEMVFRNCTSLAVIDLQNGIINIKRGAFQGCTSLSSIEIPHSVTIIGQAAFYNCPSLNSIVIPSSVTSIDRYAFYKCSGLTSIEIPDSVTEIGNAAFLGCTSLTSIPICRGVNKIGMWAFQDCTSLTSVTIPDNITYVANRAFYNCTSLTSVTIPNSVTIIGTSAFSYCRSLTSVTIPDSVTSIGSNTFSGCYFEHDKFINNSSASGYPWSAELYDVIQDDGLCISGTIAAKCRPNATNVTIPNSVTSIGQSAFSGCTSLTTIEIPDSVTSISSNAFFGCYFQSDKFINNSSATSYPWGAKIYDTIQDDGLCISGTTAVDCKENATSVTIPSSVTSIGGSDAFSYCRSLTSVTIPDSVTSIGGYAFSVCTSLTSIVIPDSVTSIGAGAFNSCSSLTSVTIPDSVTRIYDYTFQNCSGLTSVTIGNSVTSIDYNVFSSCTSLTSVTIPDSVAHIDSSAFSDTPFDKNLPNGDVYLGSCYYKYKGTMLSDTSIIIKDGTKMICNYAFQYCTNLTSVTIPSSVTEIGSSAFNGCYFERYKFINNSSATGYPWGAELYDVIQDDGLYISGTTAIKCKKNAINVTIPDSVTTIGDDAFYNCTSLTSIFIPDSVTTIGDDAFYNCTSLTSIFIPNSVTRIGDYAFSGCRSLTSVTIPSSVTSISSSAFNGCYFERYKFINNSSATGYPWGAELYDVIQDDGLYISGTTAIKCRPNATNITIPDSVTSIGSSAFTKCINLTSVTIPNSVTRIGDYAFSGCTSLTSVTIPDSVTSIGSSAFTYCHKLTSIEIPDSVTTIGSSAFAECSILTSVTIGSGVTTIGSSAFAECSILTSVTIGSGVTTIGGYAFNGCNNLTSVTIPNSVTRIGDYAFSGCRSLTSVTIPSSVTSIGSSAFDGCTSLTSVTIPDSVTSIGSSAFAACSILTSVTIGSGITSISDYAFYKCSGLTSVIIPNSVTSIGSSAFRDCTSLTSVTIPSSVTSIGTNAFSGCSSLTSLTIPSSVTSIGQYAFYGCYFQSDEFINNSNLTSSNNWSAALYDIVQDDGLCISVTTAAKCKANATNIIIPNSVTSIGSQAFSNCSGLTSVTIGSGVTSIGTYAFSGCTSLTSVIIPDSVTSIGSNTFSGCYFEHDKFINNSSASGYPWSAELYDVIQDDGLCISGTIAAKCRPNATNVTIPNSVTSIDTYAFSGCTSLTSVIIPDSVTSIGTSAFTYCYSLTSVTIPSSVTSIGQYAFRNCTSLTSVIIPDGVTSIGYGAFYNCTSLTSVTIPDSVAYIDSSAFNGTPFYNNLPNGDIYLGSCYYYYKGTMPSNTSITIKDGTKTISEYAFYKCSGLTSVIIPNSVTSIDKYAFYNCSGLTTIIIPDSVTTIGDSAFEGCTSLNYDIAPNGFAYIGKKLYKFVKPNIDNGITSIRYGCVDLKSGCLRDNRYFSMIIIPDTVTSIGSSAFTRCSSLTTIIIPDSVTRIGDYAFSGCTSLTYAEIGDGVTSMGQYTFKGCTSLEKVVIGSGVTSIGSYTFSGCTQLDEVCIKEGVEAIGAYAFNTSQLGSITLPSTIKSLVYTCFYNCGFLHEIICHATIAPTVNNSFSGLPTNGTLYVPHGSDYSSWKSLLPSGWVIKYLYEPTECTNLVITANDVNGRKTKAQISYTATTNGINPITHEVMNDVIVTGVTKSQSFEQNTSYTDTIEREITFEYLGVTASTTITQGVWVDVSYSINLQDQWRMSSAVPNPDSSLYDGVYESFSNYNVNSSSATCVVTIDGYSDFKFYIRSNGQNDYDYVDVYDLDGSNTIKATTKAIANSGITLSSYTLVEFTNLDGGEHTIKVVYKKNASSHSGTDRGYLMIPYNQDE